MKQTKTLNVATEIHKRVKVTAAKEGAQLGDLTDALLEVGLRHIGEVRQLLQVHTTQEPEPEKPR